MEVLEASVEQQRNTEVRNALTEILTELKNPLESAIGA
jgi:hypothetical protein